MGWRHAVGAIEPTESWRATRRVQVPEAAARPAPLPERRRGSQSCAPAVPASPPPLAVAPDLPPNQASGAVSRDELDEPLVRPAPETSRLRPAATATYPGAHHDSPDREGR